MRVAVTGASGFLGGWLVRALVAAGHEVVGVVRDPRRAEGLPVGLAKADLLDAPALTAALRGCDALIANAALSAGWARPDDQAFADANVTGARNQLDAARDAGVARVVWISTVAVYRTSLRAVLAEDAPRIDPDRPRFDWNHLTTDARYAISKARAEILAWERASVDGFQLTALRPGPIFGPGDPKMTARYARMLTWPVAPAPTARLPHIHAGDVALAAVGALGNPASAGRAYNVTGESVSPYAFLRAWRDAWGGRTRLVPIPVPVRVAFDDRAAIRDLGLRVRSLQDAVREMPLP